MERIIKLLSELAKKENIELYELIPFIEKEEKWISKLKKFCERYDFDPRHMTESINDPKVIPMIRGKAFEFSARDALIKSLCANRYKITNPKMNAQTGSHDIDVLIEDKIENLSFSIECKLSAKGAFRNLADGSAYTKVKCMRSRTLGVNEVARRTGKNEEKAKMLNIHNDQYQIEDFDMVITSLGNSLYQTDKVDSTFMYQPTEEQTKYLLASGVKNQKDCFNKFFVALAKDLVVDSSNNMGNQCTRKECKKLGTNTNCKFIPNYPIMKFGGTLDSVKAPWYPLSEINQLIEKLRS